MKTIIYFVLFVVVICSGCRKGNEIPVDNGYNYFPLKAGSERIYKVTDITIDEIMNIYDTLNYYLKEKIDSEYIDNSGNKAWVLLRYKSYDSLPTWEVSDLWVAQIKDNQAQQIEENLRIVKIVFPPNKYETWNGNSFNILDPKYFEITGTDEPMIINQKSYNSVLTVIEEDDESPINKLYVIEQYAKDIGLINKTEISISKVTVIDISEPIVPIEQRISRGHLYYQSLISNN